MKFSIKDEIYPDPMEADNNVTKYIKDWTGNRIIDFMSESRVGSNEMCNHWKDTEGNQNLYGKKVRILVASNIYIEQ